MQTIAFDEKRNRYMSDESIRFAYIPMTNMIHDKSCPAIKGVPTETIRFTHDFVTAAKPCRTCALQRGLRSGAKDGMKVKQYKDFFDSVNTTKGDYTELYIKTGAQTRILNNTITVWCNEDTWKIERANANGRVIIWHNNYYFGQDGTRAFYQGFHKQLPEGVTATFQAALKCIGGYGAEEHTILYKAKQFQQQGEIVRDNFKKQEVELEKRKKSILLRIAYKIQCIRNAIPWNHVEPVQEYEGFALTEAHPISKELSSVYIAYIWKSAGNEYFLDAGKIAWKNKKVSMMIGVQKGTVDIDSIVAYRIIQKSSTKIQ